MTYIRRLYLWWWDSRLILLFRLLSYQVRCQYLERRLRNERAINQELMEILDFDIHESRDPHQCVLRRNDQ